MYKYLIQPIPLDCPGHHLYSLRAYSRKYNAFKIFPKFKSKFFRKIWFLWKLIRVKKCNHLILDFTDADILIMKFIKSKSRTLNVTPYPNMSTSRIEFIRNSFTDGVRLISHTSAGVAFYRNLNIEVQEEPSPSLHLEDLYGDKLPLKSPYILCLARHLTVSQISSYFKDAPKNMGVLVLGPIKESGEIDGLFFLGIVSECFLQYLIFTATRILILHPQNFMGESAFVKHVQALGLKPEYYKLNY
jgi:hypothetical protein